MQSVSFFTPIAYGNNPASTANSVLEAADDYFYLWGKKACVISKTTCVIAGRVVNGEEVAMLKEGNSSCLVSALKIASYFTIVIPLLVLIVKAILRYKNQFYVIRSSSPENLMKINDLSNKYSAYNYKYEHPEDYGVNSTEGNPQLLDALFTGCNLPFARSTFDVYTSEIEEDIKEIVKLTPQSMNCILGTLRCREDVSPLAAACFNENIPLHMIEFLLQKGANPNATLSVNKRPVRILKDLEESLPSERFAAIKELFIKYGATVE